MREDGQRTGSILGKVPPYGRVLLWDDMEGVLKWGKPPELPSAFPAKDTRKVYSGNHCLRTEARQEAPNGWAWQWAGRQFPFRLHKKIEFWILFSRYTLNPSPGWRIRVTVYEGYVRYSAELKGSFAPDDYGWHQAILGVDMDKKVYNKRMLDGVSQGWEGMPILGNLNPLSDQAWCIVGSAAPLRIPHYCYWDCALVLEV